jgi:hypothetical protein
MKPTELVNPGMRRRKLINLVATALVASGASGAASAQTDYPNKPVRLVVPYAPGGATDVMAAFLPSSFQTHSGSSSSSTIAPELAAALAQVKSPNHLPMATPC